MGQTAIDWLVDELKKRSTDLTKWNNDLIQQAKEMEKQQMLTITHVFRDPEFKHSAVENYYNENYG
jgi:aromatic ring-opening dioxygenase LigB subunit